MYIALTISALFVGYHLAEWTQEFMRGWKDGWDG